MKYRLSRNSFVRRLGDYGYIINQLTKHDRVYNLSGAVFLSSLSRNVKSLEEGVNEVIKSFINIDYETVKADFLEFINELARDKYIVCGESEKEIDAKDVLFSYSCENPKTIINNFLDRDRDSFTKETNDILTDEFRRNPVIFACEIEVTSKCNERCIHCYIPHENKNLDIDKSLMLNLLDQLSKMSTIGLTLSGGEVFLHKDIVDFLYYARQKDFSISVLSNLTLLNKDIIKALKEVNVNLIQVSLYSMNPEEHDHITQLKGSYKKTIDSIEKLIAEDIPVQISCPVMKTNRNSYKNVLKWAYDRKMKAYTDFIMMARTDFNVSNLNERIDLKETEELIKDIIEIDEDYRTILDEVPPRSKDIDKFSKEPVCGVGINNLCVTADGNLYPCAGWQGYTIGNIKDAPLKDIWNNSPKIKFLRSITQSSFPKCLKCEAVDYCAMCMVRNFNESGGDIFKINKHFCDVAFLNKKIVEEYNNNKAAKISI